MTQISRSRAAGTHKTHAPHPVDGPARSKCGYFVSASKNLFHVADEGEEVTCSQCLKKTAPAATGTEHEHLLFRDRRNG